MLNKRRELKGERELLDMKVNIRGNALSKATMARQG